MYYRDVVKDDPDSGYFAAIDIENPRYPNRETIFNEIREICICNEQFTNSNLEWKVDRRETKERFCEELLQKYNRGLLRFNSAKAREINNLWLFYS